MVVKEVSGVGFGGCMTVRIMWAIDSVGSSGGGGDLSSAGVGSVGCGGRGRA